MRKPQITFIAAAFYAAAAYTALAAPIDLPRYGFSIEALDASPSTTTPTVALMTFLPATDGFAPNINISIQPYAESIANYITLSKDQFKQMNWTIISEKQNGSSEWAVEYSGPMQNNHLHFYARAVSANGKVYLVTATAKETQWKDVSGALRKAVDSFKAK